MEKQLSAFSQGLYQALRNDYAIRVHRLWTETDYEAMHDAIEEYDSGFVEVSHLMAHLLEIVSRIPENTDEELISARSNEFILKTSTVY
jgi:hypothetical protein